MYRSGLDVFLLHGRMNIYLEQIAKNAKLHLRKILQSGSHK